MLYPGITQLFFFYTVLQQRCYGTAQTNKKKR